MRRPPPDRQHAGMNGARPAAADAADVILRDGTTLRLRAPRRDDLDALVVFFDGLSERSRYLRFHGAVRVEPRVVEPFVEPDWVERGALIGVLDDRVVGLASWARLRDPGSAEVAFVVVDELHGKGLGTRLLEQLAARAGAAGIDWFLAEVLPENRAMLEVFEHVGFEVVRELESGTIEVRFPIAPTERLEARVDERDHVAVVASLRSFFEPRSVAVLGASPRRGTIGGELFRNVLTADFAGAAYPVNRRGESVAGVRGYAAIEEIPDEVDLAVLCLPGAQVLDAAQACLGRGIRALCVISAGFAEIGPEGVERQRRLLELVRSHGGRLIGPNCLGVAAAGPRLNATFARRAIPFGGDRARRGDPGPLSPSPSPASPSPGQIGFSSQSGALGLALIEAAEARGLGLSAFVSIGNKADVSSNDLLEWWEEDDATDLVLLYLESFGNPRKFARLARRVARSKPILAMKSGRTAAGAKAASSHTAALAGSEAAVDALFRHAGVLRAETLEELLDVTSLLSCAPLPRGRRVALLTNAGGLGILCADACEAAGLELAQLADETASALAELLPVEASTANPVDVLGSATAATYEAVLPLLVADARVDAVIVLFVPPVTAGADEVAEAVARSAGGEKPVLAVLMSAEGTPSALRQAGCPVASFPYPESAARALGRAVERAEWLRRSAGTMPELDGIDRAAAETVVGEAGEGWLDPAQTRALLAAYGLPLVPERVVADASEAAAAAAELGHPLVVKSAAAGAHKTESGGIALDLRDEAEVLGAAAQIGYPVLLQPMVQGSAELLAGLVQDPVFGPLVAFGPGGVLAELIGEASFRIAPLTDVDARELVDEGKAGRLVRGFRRAPADADALVDLVLRLSRLAEELPQVAELDLNPVLALEHGCAAVDARVRVTRAGAALPLKSW
jgi:acyl-CoA synthetase (NDP forming)/ribosomal protein S18 acetylase RimI-like enzyme